MEQSIRVITWNCRKASTTSKLWDYLLELDPDVALLQDFGTIPERVLQVYDHVQNAAADESRSVPCFMTGVLVKGNFTEEIPLPAPPEHAWVAQELVNFKEFFTAKAVRLQNGISLKIPSVYSPAFPIIEQSRLEGINTSGIQLSNYRGLWITELLWATLKSMSIAVEDLFIVGGDLNSSETFDIPARSEEGQSGNHGSSELLGLYDCLRMYKGQLTPTFRHSMSSFVHQLDYLYVTPRLLSRLTWCDVGSAERVWGSKPTLSDHLPIVAEFVLPQDDRQSQN